MRAPILGTLLGMALVTQANAAGFEKSVMWSGRHAGTAGASAVGGVTGSQSIYFNPAGLGTGSDAAVNFSPTWISVKGNLASTDRLEETDKNFVPFGALTVSAPVWNQIAIGAGAYVAGGERAVYEQVDLTGDATSATSFRPELKTDLAITEYALGAGAELIPGLRFGAAWRITKAKGSLATLKKTVANTAYVYSAVEDAEQTRYEGFRLGLQYEAPESAWGLGAAYRNAVDFSATGKATGSVFVIPTASLSGAVVSPVTIGLSFPEQYSLGGFYRFTESFRFFAAADFTKYSKDEQISITGSMNSVALGGTVALPNIPLGWKDQWNIRLGGEYSMDSWMLRAGYSLTTRVTSTIDAKATIPPAGTGHLLALGAGTNLAQNWDLDGALEYGWNNGHGSMSATPQGSTTKELLAGTATDTKARTFGVHTGVTYKF